MQFFDEGFEFSDFLSQGGGGFSFIYHQPLKRLGWQIQGQRIARGLCPPAGRPGWRA
jgi:hypothetical protein